MIEFQIGELVPKFLMEDKRGRAMALAIEKGLEIFCQTVKTGVETVLDTEKMPMWRLDEMAWELDCLYEYTETDIAKKRKWIQSARELYGKYGTAEAIYRYLSDYFPKAYVEENWEYGGESYRFRVTLEGGLDGQREKWARKTIDQVKNLRSVLEGFAVGCDTDIIVRGSTQVFALRYPKPGQRNTGQWPRTHAVGGYGQDGARAGVEAEGSRFYYDVSGTAPNIAHLYRGSEAQAAANGQGTGTLFFYGPTQGNPAGLAPKEATVGGTGDGTARAQAEGTGNRFPYGPAQGDPTGQEPTETTVSGSAEGQTRAGNTGEGTVFLYPYAGEGLCGETT